MDLLELFKDTDNIITLKAEEVLFTKGEEGELMYVVLEGIVALYVGYDVMDFMEAGEVLGEMAIIDDQKRSATAVAKTDCRLIPVTKDTFLSMVKETPDFSMYLMKVFARRLRNMNNLQTR